MNDDHYFNLLMNLPHFVDKNSLQQAAYNIFKINPIIINIPYSYSIRMTWLDYAKKILACQKKYNSNEFFVGVYTDSEGLLVLQKNHLFQI